MRIQAADEILSFHLIVSYTKGRHTLSKKFNRLPKYFDGLCSEGFCRQNLRRFFCFIAEHNLSKIFWQPNELFDAFSVVYAEPYVVDR